jgi:hypothetical protein
MICVWIDTRVLVAAAVLGLLVERVLGITDARLVQVFFFLHISHTLNLYLVIDTCCYEFGAKI